MKRFFACLLVCALFCPLLALPAGAYDAAHRTFYGTRTDQFWLDFQGQLDDAGLPGLVGPVQETTFHSLAAYGGDITVFVDADGAKGFFQRADVRLNVQGDAPGPAALATFSALCQAALAPCAPTADFETIRAALSLDQAHGPETAGCYAGAAVYASLHRGEGQWDFCLTAAPEDQALPHTVLDNSFVGAPFEPVAAEGAALVPLRAVGEQAGAAITWDSAVQTATVDYYGVISTLRIGTKQAVVRGKTTELSAPPRLVEGRTMVPLDFLENALSFTALWDGPSQVAVLFSENAFIR